MVGLLLRGQDEIPIAGPLQTPAASPTPAPTPTPTERAPVLGERRIETVVTSEGPIVFHVDDRRHRPPETDQAAVDTFAHDIADWLDEHVADLLDGGDGLVQQIAFQGKLAGGSDAVLPGITTELVERDEPPTRVVYRIVVMASGEPEWAQVRVGVIRSDDTKRAAELTFVRTRRGRANLIAAGPVDPESRPMRVLPHPREDVWDR